METIGKGGWIVLDSSYIAVSLSPTDNAPKAHYLVSFGILYQITQEKRSNEQYPFLERSITRGSTTFLGQFDPLLNTASIAS